MKKKFITTICVLLLAVDSVYAESYTKSFKGLDINVKTPSTKPLTTSKIYVNKAAMKAQISAINSKVNYVSSTYQASVNNLANNLLPNEQLKIYNEEKVKIQNFTKSKETVNIDIAENGIILLNKYLKKSSSNDKFKNLTVSQKYAVKRDLNNLKNVSNSYAQIADQQKTLIKQIKADPFASLELKTDLTEMTKNEVKVTKQVKNITQLTKNMTTLAEKEGVSL